MVGEPTTADVDHLFFLIDPFRLCPARPIRTRVTGCQRLTRYMAGPVILHHSPWAETLPQWVIPTIYVDRVEQIAREVREGTIGALATPLEVMAYMYPATLDAPLADEWVQVYLYCGQEALAKHGKLPVGQSFAQTVLGEEQPLALPAYIQSQFLMPLQRDMRRKVVQLAAERGVAKPP